MKFSIQRDEIFNVISRTQTIIEKRNAMSILLNILFDYHDGVLNVFSTDLEVSLKYELKVTDSENHFIEGKAAINARVLFDVLKEMESGFVEFTAKENYWIEIKQNNAVSNIVGVNFDEFPVFPSFVGDHFFKISTEILSEMLVKTSYSVSTDETRYHLNGVFFEKQDGENKNVFRMVATDGHRLSLVDRMLNVEIGNELDLGIIIPRKALIEIRKVLELNFEFAEIAIESSQMIVKMGPCVLMVRLIEGRYPNYQQLIPQNLGYHVIVKREALLASIRRVSVLSNQKSKGLGFHISSGKLMISSGNSTLGDAKEELEVMYKGDDISIGFNARYLIDVLSSFDDEEVDIELKDERSPGIFRPHNDFSYTCVIMPMRI